MQQKSDENGESVLSKTVGDLTAISKTVCWSYIINDLINTVEMSTVSVVKSEPTSV